MDLIFANPAGWWALLGVPVVLAIHFLQRKSRRVVTSTLFLLDQMSPVSAQGRRIERLRNSIPLWLQLLAVLILAWLMAQPRWLRNDSAQTVAVVLDSSISMKVWRAPVIATLTNRLENLSHSAARTEWVLTESDLTRPTLYSGSELPALLEKLTDWKPSLGTHDPDGALRVAQSLLRRNGVAIFVTDRPHTPPEGVRVLAVGEPFDNVGFIGLRVEGDMWTALVQNHGTQPQSRSWRIESGGQSGPAAPITLEPGQTRAISGKLPPGMDRCELVLDADRFDSDDRLPIVRPDPKRLQVAVQP
ncbi:MAG: BatA domain-containing protein, partial [Chthoniobacterales bacterium]